LRSIYNIMSYVDSPKKIGDMIRSGTGSCILLKPSKFKEEYCESCEIQGGEISGVSIPPSSKKIIKILYKDIKKMIEQLLKKIFLMKK